MRQADHALCPRHAAAAAPRGGREPDQAGPQAPPQRSIGGLLPRALARFRRPQLRARAAGGRHSTAPRPGPDQTGRRAGRRLAEQAVAGRARCLHEDQGDRPVGEAGGRQPRLPPPGRGDGRARTRPSGRTTAGRWPSTTRVPRRWLATWGRHGASPHQRSATTRGAGLANPRRGQAVSVRSHRTCPPVNLVAAGSARPPRVRATPAAVPWQPPGPRPAPGPAPRWSDPPQALGTSAQRCFPAAWRGPAIATGAPPRGPRTVPALPALVPRLAGVAALEPVHAEAAPVPWGHDAAWLGGLVAAWPPVGACGSGGRGAWAVPPCGRGTARDVGRQPCPIFPRVARAFTDACPSRRMHGRC